MTSASCVVIVRNKTPAAGGRLYAKPVRAETVLAAVDEAVAAVANAEDELLTCAFVPMTERRPSQGKQRC